MVINMLLSALALPAHAAAPASVINATIDCTPQGACVGDFLLQLSPRGKKLELPVGFVTTSLAKRASTQTSSVLGSAHAAVGNASAVLSDFSGYDLDVYVLHGQTLWPCTGRDGSLERPLRYAAPGSYAVSANFTTDSAGEPIYACTYRGSM